MGDLLRVEALLVKKESSYGVDVTPGVTDAVRITARLFPLLKTRFLFDNRRDDATTGGLISAKRGIVKGGLVDLDIPWEIKGKGSAYALSTDIEADPLIQACGFSVAVDVTGAAEKLTYAPVDTGHASCTIYAYAGGQLYKILGCRGNMKWPVKAGEQGVMNFAMTGMLAADPTTVSVPSATYDSSLPPAAVGMAFTLNAGSPYTPVMSDSEFNIANGVEPEEDANSADGISQIKIFSRLNPLFTCTIKKDPLATYDPRARLKAVTSHTIAQTLGATQYNRAKLAVSESYLTTDPVPVEYKGDAGWQLSFDVKAGTIVFD